MSIKNSRNRRKSKEQNMGKMIVVDVEKCIGCGTCEMVCAFKHHDEFNRSKSRIHNSIFLEDGLAISVVCYQCEDPSCGKICPSGAITTKKDENSGATLVTVSEIKCIGCKMCTLVCPYGCIVVSDSGYAEKCDLCGGDPECVKFCATGAISFIEPEQNMIAKKRGVAAKLLNIIKNSDASVPLDV
jgi:Fe-S-cluster-containing hydrogenase component 2